MVMPIATPLAAARQAAAAMLHARGYPREAAIVRAGDGDDFAEVRIALELIKLREGQEQRLLTALTTYADPDFWEGEDVAQSAAFDDRGDIARTALATARPTIRAAA